MEDLQTQLAEVRSRVVREALEVGRQAARDRENEANVAERLDPRWGVAQQAAEAREMALQRRENQR